MPYGIFRRHDRVDVAAEHFSGAIAEQLAGLVEHEHTCLCVDHDDPVDGSVEHAQQPGFGNRGQYWSRIDDLALVSATNCSRNLSRMNHSLLTADRTIHLQIVVVALMPRLWSSRLA